MILSEFLLLFSSVNCLFNENVTRNWFLCCIIWLFGILFGGAKGVRRKKNACAQFGATKLVNRWAEHDTEQKLWAEQNETIRITTKNGMETMSNNAKAIFSCTYGNNFFFPFALFARSLVPSYLVQTRREFYAECQMSVCKKKLQKNECSSCMPVAKISTWNEKRRNAVQGGDFNMIRCASVL